MIVPKNGNLIIITLFLTTSQAAENIIATEAGSQLSLHTADAQNEHTTTLIHGNITAATSYKPFGGEAVGAYSVVLVGQKISINIYLHKLPQPGYIFEAQLVDTNTNSTLSLGQVDAKNSTLPVSQSIMILLPYNEIIILNRQATTANTLDLEYSQPIGGATLPAPFGNNFIF